MPLESSACSSLEINSIFVLCSYVGLPSNDTNAWYYPSPGYDSEEDDDVQLSAAVGNWGRKMLGGSRWVRKGKMAAWGPGIEDWEVRLFVCPH